MTPLTYKKAGVDIDEAERFIKKIKPLLQKTERPEVLGRIGGFGGLFKPRLRRLQEPVLVSATDGVGTKLLLADFLEKYDTIGVDLVAMCVDDVVVVGAEPLYFLDYIACGKLNSDKLYTLMKGITKGCREAGCALIGGETAELPGMYTKDKLDLAGFCVGIVSGRFRLLLRRNRDRANYPTCQMQIRHPADRVLRCHCVRHRRRIHRHRSCLGRSGVGRSLFRH